MNLNTILRRLLSQRSILIKNHLHSSAQCNAKAAHFMNKILTKANKRKHRYNDSDILPTVEMLTKGTNEGRFSGNARRTSVLNKLFMRHITDLLISGDYSEQFLKHNIDINRIQIAPDYKCLNVFFSAKGNPDYEEIERFLKKNAGFLRHELSVLRVMGNVPVINFVKDKKNAQLAALDSKLAIADFGEDYTPLELEHKLKTSLELFAPLPKHIKERIENLEAETCDDNEEPLPEMPQNVLGLNHYEIMSRIKKTMKKSQGLHRQNNTELQSESVVNETPVQFATSSEKRAAFKQFLEQREILRSKSRKLEREYVLELENFKEECEERQREFFRNMHHYEDDFVEDDVVSD